MNKSVCYKSDLFEISKQHPNDKDGDWIPLKTWRYLYGGQLFVSDKMIHYHTKKLEAELINAGSMAKVKSRVYLHKNRFFNDYQQAMKERRLNEN